MTVSGGIACVRDGFQLFSSFPPSLFLGASADGVPFRVDFMRAQLRFPRRTTSFRWNLVHTVLVNVLMFFIILVLQKYARLQQEIAVPGDNIR